MAATTYATVRQNTQSTVHGLLKANSPLIAKSVKIIDGTPRNIIRDRASYIIVGTPNTTHNNWVIDNSRFYQDITVPITISSRKEANTRELADLVINALKTTQSTTRSAKLFKFKIKSATESTIPVGRNELAYLYNINVGYVFAG
jgi:hypothetical protein